MCGCGKNKPAPPKPPPSSGGVQSFTLDRNGATATYGSKLEAIADNMRAGGTGRIRPLR